MMGGGEVSRGRLLSTPCIFAVTWYDGGGREVVEVVGEGEEEVVVGCVCVGGGGGMCVCGVGLIPGWPVVP